MGWLLASTVLFALRKSPGNQKHLLVSLMSLDQKSLGSSTESSQQKSPIIRKLIIVGSVLGIALVFIALLVITRPQADKRPIPETVVKVDVTQVAPSAYPVLVTTSGTIQADTRGNLVAQVRGEIVKVAESFRSGGSFEEGEVLIEIDPRDYTAELSQASAAVSQAQATYSQEQAFARQAAKDWERLGNSGEAPDLVLRKPQLAAAKAQLDSANARFETAQLNLSRTKITAPYTGRIIERNAALGQYVSIGTPLAEVFATNLVEVRLPLSQTEFSQLGLDGAFTNADKNDFGVTLSTQLGTQTHSWEAVLTRADSTFDLNTRQIDVFARVIDPFSNDGSKPPLKIGQFVNATIKGQTLENVVVIPNKALREGSYVFVSQDKTLVRTPVSVAWQDDQNALIESGLNTGDLVVTTSLNSTLAGAKVKLPESFNPANIASPSSDDAASNATSSVSTPE